MKRFFFLITGLAAGFCLLAGFSQWLEAQQRNTGFPTSQPPNSLPWLQGANAPMQDNLPFTIQPRKRESVKEGSEPNRDIVINPELGEWMILICAYSGPERHVWARQMVAELRGPNYRLPAYVFNYGRKERIEEDERIDKYVQEKRANYLKLHKEHEMPLPEKITIRRIPIKEEAGVLVGGYAEMQTAKRALDNIKKLKMPDPKKVKLDQIGTAHRDKETGEVIQKWSNVNPFERAFVVRNPSIPQQKETQADLLDINVLRNLNSEEPYSLLKCPKKFTLVVKQFNMPTMIQQELDPRRVAENSVFNFSPSQEDVAAQSAHNLAKAFRDDMKLEAYVLHTKYYSLVTVGGFDSVTDPRLKMTQQQLERMLNNPVVFEKLRHFPKAWPMKVPR